MGSKIPNTKKLIAIFLFVLALIFSRVYNLDKTAHFIRDESSDLVNMHQIYIEKKLTLVGPISEDGSEVFGSLTYYMLLPFAIIGHFDPVSTAYGAAFWGILTGILLLYLTYKINKKIIYLIAPIIILWYPLVETGRWAWNPNLVPFWVSLSLIFFFRKGNLFKFFSGLAIGLSFHLHYIAILSCIGLGLIILFDSVKSKNLGGLVSYVCGIILTTLPFVIFDLRHPPGLFFSRFIYFNNLGGIANEKSILNNIVLAFQGTFQYFIQSIYLEVALIFILILLFYSDIKEKSRALFFIGVFLIQLAGVALVTNFFPRYIIQGVPFFFVYLIYPRKSTGKILSYLVLIVVIITSILSFPKQITAVAWENNTNSARFISNTIYDEIVKNNLKNNNVIILASPDTNTIGSRYRNLLLIKGVTLRAKNEYQITDHLFVVSISDIDKVRNDPAYEVGNFRKGKLIREWTVPESPWKIYLLSRSPT